MQKHITEKLTLGGVAATVIDGLEAKHYGNEILDVFHGVKTLPEALGHLGHLSDFELGAVIFLNILFVIAVWTYLCKFIKFITAYHFRVHDHPTWVFDACIKDGEAVAFQEHLRFVARTLRKAGYCREIDSYGYSDKPSRMCVQVYLTKTARISFEEIKGMFGSYLCDVAPLKHL